MEQYKVLEEKKDVPVNKMEIYDEDEDPEIAMLEKMIAERRARRKQENEM